MDYCNYTRKTDPDLVGSVLFFWIRIRLFVKSWIQMLDPNYFFWYRYFKITKRPNLTFKNFLNYNHSS